MKKVTISQAATILSGMGITLSHAACSPATGFRAYYTVSNDDRLAVVSAQELLAFLNGDRESLL